jgi:hypothetical protein
MSRLLMIASGTAMTVLLAVGCSSATAGPPTARTAATATVARPTASSPAPGASPAPSPSKAPIPRFWARVSGPLTEHDVPHSWRPGCPVPPRELRAIRMSYLGFDRAAHKGELIVNASVVKKVIKVFARLYRARFPIKGMKPVDAYHGSDPESMAADNTSAFNCRRAVAPGPPQWSMHAYGLAIDVNTVQNPYVETGAGVQPPAGAAYLNRSDIRPGMAYPGGVLVKAFTAIGWGWGGNWSGSPDYQHFSSNGS